MRQRLLPDLDVMDSAVGTVESTTAVGGSRPALAEVSDVGRFATIPVSCSPAAPCTSSDCGSAGCCGPPVGPGKRNPTRPSVATPDRLPHQVFHGAPPDAQRSSSRFRSRTVSIGCQNPWCS